MLRREFLKRMAWVAVGTGIFGATELPALDWTQTTGTQGDFVWELGKYYTIEEVNATTGEKTIVSGMRLQEINTYPAHHGNGHLHRVRLADDVGMNLPREATYTWETE
jgi:hypothetical protein